MYFAHYAPYSPQSFAPVPQAPFAPTLPVNPIELSLIHQRLDQLTGQVAYLNETIRRLSVDLFQRNIPPGFAPATAGGNIVGFSGGQGGGYLMNGANHVNGASHGVNSQVGSDSSFSRFRENESFLCWELFIPGLSLNDLEVEIVGNRVIARTRTVLHPNHRQVLLFSLPRGIEAFELPDGRFECCWAVPVGFEPKEVESAFRDGWISIYVPKVGAAQRHSVRVSKDASHSSRKAGELTA